MATPWISEPETGRWYINQTSDGRVVRRYSDELEHQEESGYQPEYQDQVSQTIYPSEYRDNTSSRGHTSLSGRETRETPRYFQPPLSAGRSDRGQSVSVAQPQRSSRGERRYHEDQGYNPSQEEGERADDRPPFETYQHPVPASSSSTRDDFIYDESMSEATVALGGMTVNDPGLMSGYSNYSPPQHSAPLSMAGSSRITSQYKNTPMMSSPPGSWGTNYTTTGSRGTHRAPGEGILVRGTPGEAETLDPSYRVRNTDYKTFFRPGRVFKTLWTDAAGPPNNTSSEHSQWSEKKFKVAHGEYVYSKIRRFVVVKQNDRSCQCLPVTTYDGKGYKKRGINLDHHGLIYSGDDVPYNEAGLVKHPLRVKQPRHGEMLNKNSYINYGRAYCVDTNVKVKDLGELDSESRKNLRAYYREVQFPLDEESSTTPKLQAEQLVAETGTGFQSYYESVPGMTDSMSTAQSTMGPSSPSIGKRRESISSYGKQPFDANYGHSYDPNPASPPWSDPTLTSADENPGTAPAFGDDYELDQQNYGQSEEIILPEPQRHSNTGEKHRRHHRERGNERRSRR